MKVESVPLESLKPYDNNAKRHTPEQIEAVGNSIREFGSATPSSRGTTRTALPRSLPATPARRRPRR